MKTASLHSIRDLPAPTVPPELLFDLKEAVQHVWDRSTPSRRKMFDQALRSRTLCEAGRRIGVTGNAVRVAEEHVLRRIHNVYTYGLPAAKAPKWESLPKKSPSARVVLMKLLSSMGYEVVSLDTNYRQFWWEALLRKKGRHLMIFSMYSMTDCQKGIRLDPVDPTREGEFDHVAVPLVPRGLPMRSQYPHPLRCLYREAGWSLCHP